MAPDSTFPAPPLKPDSPSRWKFRVRFGKSGDLRLVSHHDLMHVFERMFRRADLPILATQGFNPRPRMWFALSLALGVGGLNEVLELEIADPLTADEVKQRLIRQCPLGLEIKSVRSIDPKLGARVRRAWYRLPFRDENVMKNQERGITNEEVVGDEPTSKFPVPHSSFPIALDRNGLDSKCRDFLDGNESWVERIRPNRRRVNVRPYVDELHVADDHLTMALWITPNGAARPEEIIAAVGLQHLLDAGVVIERTDLEIYDELPPGIAGPPTIQQETNPNDETSVEARPAPRPTAIIDSPFSFET